MFLAALFIIVKNCIFLQVDKQAIKYEYNGVLLAFMKEHLIHTTWVHLRIILQSEKSQTQAIE